MFLFENNLEKASIQIKKKPKKIFSLILFQFKKLKFMVQIPSELFGVDLRVRIH